MSNTISIPRQRQELFGLELDALTLRQVVSECEGNLATRKRTQIGVLNAAKVVNLRHDDMLRESLVDCDLLLADGQSVVWASQILGRPLPERVAGIDLFQALMDLADRRGSRVYLLGAAQDVLDELLRTVARRWPNAVVAGSSNGYFTADESPAIAEHIKQSKADMLFIGITSPKKEIFLGTYGDDLGVPIMHGVGGSFDVLAGVTRRAPQAWQKVGLEWAYRLLQEPRRLFKRYARTNALFLGLLLVELGRRFHLVRRTQQGN